VTAVARSCSSSSSSTVATLRVAATPLSSSFFSTSLRSSAVSRHFQCTTQCTGLQSSTLYTPHKCTSISWCTLVQVDSTGYGVLHVICIAASPYAVHIHHQYSFISAIRVQVLGYDSSSVCRSSSSVVIEAAHK
jgi:hypothetical protein